MGELTCQAFVPASAAPMSTAPDRLDHREASRRLWGAASGPRSPLSFVGGVQIMRQMIGLSALADCFPAVLIKLLEPVFQQFWACEPNVRP